MGDTGVNQSRFFMPGDDIDTKTQVPLGAGQKQLRVVRIPDSTCRYRPHAARFETTQFFPESRQRLPSAIQRQLIQYAAVKALGQSDGLTQGLHFLDQESLISPH
ncbi:hypothetical protein D3C84_1026880 [compost metagenome]